MRREILGAAAVLAALLTGTAAVRADDPPPPPANPAEPREHAEVAKARRDAAVLCGKREFDAAIALLREASKQHGATAGLLGDEGWAWFRRAQAERENGMDDSFVRALFADALIRARRSLELDPELTASESLLVQSLRESGDEAGSETACAEWLEKHPQDAAIRSLLAGWLFAAREWEKSDFHYTKILLANPADGTAWLHRTTARQWMRMAGEEVEKGYLEAARLLPEDDAPLKALASLYPRQRDRNLALLAKVIEANPKAVWARVWVAYLLRTQDPQDARRALATLREAEAIAPDNPGVRMQIGEMLAEAGDVHGAVAAYTACVEKSPAGAASQASALLDRLLFEAPADALPLAAREHAYDVLCAGNPAVGNFGNNAGFWFRDVGRDYEKSLKYYLLSVKAAPDDQDFLNDTALLYLFHLTDRKERCLPLFEKVLRLVEKERQEPVRGYWDALENLCKYWFEKGSYAKVIECADKRADPAASLEGRPYPSLKAAQWRLAALRELEKQK